MKKILIVQHEEDTPPGTTLEWAQNRGYAVEMWSPATQNPPTQLDHDLVVICGGSMDTHEEKKYPWLVTEKKVLRRLLDQETKIFGLCLGSQLLAEVLGGSVHQHVGWEIGFIPVTLNNGQTLSVFHWHRYTFELPPGAELLAQGTYCRNQAFRYGSHIIATQFHPEATLEWIQESAQEVRQHQGNVQSADEIMRSLSLQAPMKAWYFEKLDELVKN